ncbi:NAD(P)-dependent oxidoreductase [Hartmannibacter diazotrophicus]|nr:NAD(P)-dependent oxidoreductase [Hartmannibacter diazotrophicus]
MTRSLLFIGVGRMGSLMAGHLVDSGYDVALADLSPEALEPFAASGCPTATTAADLPGDIVITMLPTDAHVREALLGENGALASRKRQTVIDMSSVSPEATRSLAAELATYGTTLLDAPVSGGMAGAKTASLIGMVGGEPDVFAACQPILEAMCSKVIHVGPVGSGHVVKALNNYLSAATLWTATEALTVGTRLGLDPARMLEVWTAGSGRSHATEVKLPDHVLTRSFDFGQSLKLFCKDIGIASDLAAKAGAETPALDALKALWEGARDSIGPEADITRIASMMEAMQKGSGGKP